MAIYSWNITVTIKMNKVNNADRPSLARLQTTLSYIKLSKHSQACPCSVFWLLTILFDSQIPWPVRYQKHFCCLWAFYTGESVAFLTLYMIYSRKKNGGGCRHEVCALATPHHDNAWTTYVLTVQTRNPSYHVSTKDSLTHFTHQHLFTPRGRNSPFHLWGPISVRTSGNF